MAFALSLCLSSLYNRIWKQERWLACWNIPASPAPPRLSLQDDTFLCYFGQVSILVKEVSRKVIVWDVLGNVWGRLGDNLTGFAILKRKATVTKP